VSGLSEYRGTVELLDGNDGVIQTVHVYLRQDRRSGLAVWGGSIDPSEYGPRDWQDVRKIRLENGEVGDVILAEHKMESGGPFGSHQRGVLKGSGPAPF